METALPLELLKKILELEQSQEQLKQKMSRLKLSAELRKRSSSKTGDRAPSWRKSCAAEGRPSAVKFTDRQYLNVLQSMSQSVHVLDLNFRVIFWSDMSEKFYGYSAAEVVGQNPLNVLVDDRDAPFALNVARRCANGETWAGELPVKTKSGRMFPAFCTLSPFYDDNGSLIGVITITIDPVHYRNPISDFATKVRNKVRPKMRAGVNIATLSDHKDDAASCVASTPRGDFIQYPFGVFTNTEASSLWSSSTNTNSTSNVRNCGSSSGELGYEILWDDLTIGEQIRQGSCGTVYRGLWFGSDVAVKVFPKLEYSEEVIQSFRQEVSLMKGFRHPNVVLYMGAVTTPQRLCIVSEFVPRGSLFRLLQRTMGKLDWRRRIQMALDIARGMNYLHCCSPPIVHRDLKSSNLLVGRNCTVKVANFGLSRVKRETYLTAKSGKGTPQWMAPEVLRNESVDEKSDIYSFGVVLWELATEKIPWETFNPMQVVGAVGFMNQRLEIPKDIDPLWISLIESCWHSDAKLRPTFQELIEKLRDLQRKYTMQCQAICTAGSIYMTTVSSQGQN